MKSTTHRGKDICYKIKNTAVREEELKEPLDEGEREE